MTVAKVMLMMIMIAASKPAFTRSWCVEHMNREMSRRPIAVPCIALSFVLSKTRISTDVIREESA